MASVSKRQWVFNGVERSAWVVRYLDNGKHRSKQFPKKKEADAYKQMVEREIFDGIHVAYGDGATIREIALQYLKSEEDRYNGGQIARSHYRNIRIYVERAIVPYLGDRRLNQLRGGDIEDWVRKICREHRLTVRTARRRLGELNRIADFALQRGMLKLNPVPPVFKRMRPGARKPISTFSQAQVINLLRLAEIREANKQRRAFMMMRAVLPLAAMCGLRWGEIFGLTMKHVKLAERVIEVRHSLTYYDELRPPKTKAGVRDVPLPDYALERLSEWIEFGAIENERGLVFTTHQGEGVRPASFRQTYWIPLLQRAGLYAENDVFHFHALRHFASSLMIAQGLPLTDTASLLGHLTFDMTLQVYAHPIVGGHRRAEVVNAVANSLFTPVATA